MQDWIGILFFVLLAVGIWFGLRSLAKPQTRTSDEFERRAAEGSGTMGAFVNALQDAVDPAAAKSKEVIMQMHDGNYQKKKREGKANADINCEDTESVEND
jgi:hypothetical protein